MSYLQGLRQLPWLWSTLAKSKMIGKIPALKSTAGIAAGKLKSVIPKLTPSPLTQAERAATSMLTNEAIKKGGLAWAVEGLLDPGGVAGDFLGKKLGNQLSRTNAALQGKTEELKKYKPSLYGEPGPDVMSEQDIARLPEDHQAYIRQNRVEENVQDQKLKEFNAKGTSTITSNNNKVSGDGSTSEQKINITQIPDKTGDGNPWSIQNLQDKGIINTNFTKEQIANTTNDFTVAGVKLDNNTQETTKPAKIPNPNHIGNMTQLELEQTGYGDYPNESPARNSVRQNKATIQSINNPSGETNPANSIIEKAKDPMSGFSDEFKDIMNRNPEMKQDFLKDLKIDKGGDAASSGSNVMGKTQAVLGLMKAAGIGQPKEKEGTGQMMGNNTNIASIIPELDPYGILRMG